MPGDSDYAPTPQYQGGYDSEYPTDFAQSPEQQTGGDEEDAQFGDQASVADSDELNDPFFEEILAVRDKLMNFEEGGAKNELVEALDEFEKKVDELINTKGIKSPELEEMLKTYNQKIKELNA